MIKKPAEIIGAMLDYSGKPLDRDAVRGRFRAWLAGRVGGAALAAGEIQRHIPRP